MSVERTMECQARVNDVFFAVSLNGTMRSVTSVQLEKKRLGDLFVVHALCCHFFSLAKSSCAGRTIMHEKCFSTLWI